VKRFEIIDGMRGYFLVFMLINHLTFTGGYWLVEFNHRQFAFVEDAQGFVFLSGFLIGLVYGKKMLKAGYEEGRSKVWSRAFELYRYAIGIILAVLVVRLLLPGEENWQNWLGDTSLFDPKRLLMLATFIFQPTFMDILPQYIIYMIFAPQLIWLCLQGKWMHVAVGSLIVWMAGQLGLHRIVTEPINMFAVGTDDQGMRAAFNLLGWQIVFISALVLGALTAKNSIDWNKVFSSERDWVPKAALAVCLFFLPLRVLTAHGWMPDDLIQRFAAMEVRADFGPVYLINFAAVAVGMSWMVIAGPAHHNATVRAVANGIVWLFSLSFLRLLGRHSLQIYVWHVALIYAVNLFDTAVPDSSQVVRIAIAFVCIGLLALPALWREEKARRSKMATA